MVDALASGASAFTGVLVRVQSRAPNRILRDSRSFTGFFFIFNKYGAFTSIAIRDCTRQAKFFWYPRWYPKELNMPKQAKLLTDKEIKALTLGCHAVGGVAGLYYLCS